MRHNIIPSCSLRCKGLCLPMKWCLQQGLLHEKILLHKGVMTYMQRRQWSERRSRNLAYPLMNDALITPQAAP